MDKKEITMSYNLYQEEKRNAYLKGHLAGREALKVLVSSMVSGATLEELNPDGDALVPEEFAFFKNLLKIK